MPIKKFTAAAQHWQSCCADYKARDQKYDADYQNKLKINSESIVRAESAIRTLDSAIANNEARIRQYVQETYEKKLFDTIGGVVSRFGVSASIVDKSADAEREVNSLKANLTRRKQLQHQINDRKNVISQFEAERQKLKTELRAAFVKEKQEFIQKITAEYNQYNARCVSGYHMASLPPANAAQPPRSIILGNQQADIPGLKNILCNGSLTVPYEVDLRNEGNFIIHITQQDLYDEKLEKMVVGMLLKYIEAFPATKIHLGVFSSMLPSLNSLNALYRAMKDKGCTLFDAGISSRSKLGELLDKIATYIVSPEDKIIELSCGDIYDLYDQVPDSDPFQIVLLYNAFTDISEENLLKIYSYISGYHKYGVRFIIVEDFASINVRNSASFTQALENVKKSCTSIIYNGGKPTVNGIRTDMVSLGDDFDRSKIIAYCKHYLGQKSTAPYITYESIGFGVEKKDANNYESISIPIGISGTTVCSIAFASISSSKTPIPIANLILGQSGTGKTKLIDAMIYNGAMKYSPQDVIFHLLDFKDGSMSAAYKQDENKIPHVEVISANNDAEEAGFILDNIIAENTRRVKTFQKLANTLGTTIDNIALYNKLIDDNHLSIPKIPRLIMAIDECQTLFDSDILASKTQDIIRKGRSQGIHLVLATQAMTSNMRKVVRFIDGLYVFQAVEEDIQTVLDKPFHSRVNKEVPKGSYQAFASRDAGKTCTKFKVAFYGDGRMGHYAQAVRKEWNITEPFKPLEIGENSKLVLRASECEEIFGLSGDFCVPLGENYQNRRPEYFSLSRAGYAPTLLVGSSEDVACGITTSILLSAKFSGIPVYAVDVSHAQALAKIKNECFPDDDTLQIGAGKDYREIFVKLYRIYQERMQERNENPTKEFSPIAFIVNGAHEITDYCDNTLYEEGGEKSQAAPEVPAKSSLRTTSFASFRESRNAARNTQSFKTEKVIKISARSSLIELIEKGAKLGIYVCLWFDKNDVSSERKDLRDSCDIKILFPAFKSQKESYLDASFKEKMLSRINQNMAFVEHSTDDGIRTFKRLRVYQYDLNDPDTIRFIKNFNVL